MQCTSEEDPEQHAGVWNASQTRHEDSCLICDEEKKQCIVLFNMDYKRDGIYHSCTLINVNGMKIRMNELNCTFLGRFVLLEGLFFKSKDFKLAFCRQLKWLNVSLWMRCFWPCSVFFDRRKFENCPPSVSGKNCFN